MPIRYLDPADNKVKSGIPSCNCNPPNLMDTVDEAIKTTWTVVCTFCLGFHPAQYFCKGCGSGWCGRMWTV